MWNTGNFVVTLVIQMTAVGREIMQFIVGNDIDVGPNPAGQMPISRIYLIKCECFIYYICAICLVSEISVDKK